MALVIFGSVYEGMARYKDKSEYQRIISTYWGRVIAAFSILRNWERFVMVKTSREVEKLRCLQGVRFYNTILVIFCHTSLSFLMGPVANTKYTETDEKKEEKVNYPNLQLHNIKKERIKK
ncbi:uncharacterized protein LOC108915750 [Anoplophora glabripennis]|uniref:uncharacterized protein LOC108915750 n=1 Tax=Anoplophora glabripennis TaxID=217634 RepID=UPI00087451FF|nr:uncharacterized protein LOC108915750 [Anoplophora glabripennis]